MLPGRLADASRVISEPETLQLALNARLALGILRGGLSHILGRFDSFVKICIF